MRVLAIDPGYDRLGIALVEGDASSPRHLWSACIEPARGERAKRLAEVAEAVEAAITKYSPDVLALETLFFSTNRKTALKVAEARGAALAAAGRAGVRVAEYSPQEVKLAVAGYGRADKRAIARIVPRLLALPAGNRLDDEFDAIALGIAALAQKSLSLRIEAP